jgi:hypothetical protein
MTKNIKEAEKLRELGHQQDKLAGTKSAMESPWGGGKNVNWQSDVPA